MAASGYGDLLGKVIAGADWMIAGALGIETIEPTAWEHSQYGLRDWTADPEALRRREPGAFSLLIEGLLMAGLSMQAARSSRPASGSEHLFSHLWEMEGVKSRLRCALAWIPGRPGNGGRCRTGGEARDAGSVDPRRGCTAGGVARLGTC